MLLPCCSLLAQRLVPAFGVGERHGFEPAPELSATPYQANRLIAKHFEVGWWPTGAACRLDPAPPEPPFSVNPT
jgi:hypothetical protein